MSEGKQQSIWRTGEEGTVRGVVGGEPVIGMYCMR